MTATMSVSFELLNNSDAAYQGMQLSADNTPVASGGTTLAVGEQGWGAHQPRLIRLSDGTIYALYMAYTKFASSGAAAGQGTWKLRKRTGTNTWVDVANGNTYDDCTLMRDPRDDTVYVTAYPAGTLRTFSSRDGDWGSGTPAGVIVGGTSPFTTTFPSNTRHYGNIGIGYDGTIAFKESLEVPWGGAETTSQTRTLIMTGKYNKTTSAWEWSPFQSVYIGKRSTYDYLFPNPNPSMPQGIYAVSESNWHASDTGEYPNNGLVYVFNGFTQYFINPYKVDSYLSRLDRLYDPNSFVTTTYFNNRPDDVLMDGKGRVHVICFRQGDGTGLQTTQGFHYSVMDAITLKPIFDTYLSNMLTFGNTKLARDANDNIYIIQTAFGSTINNSTFMVYKLQETQASKSTPWLNSTWAVVGSTDLHSSLSTIAPQFYALYTSNSRGGNAPLSNGIDFYLNARNTAYDAGGGTYDQNNSFNKTSTTGGIKIYYGQIQFD